MLAKIMQGSLRVFDLAASVGYLLGAGHALLLAPIAVLVHWTGPLGPTYRAPTPAWEVALLAGSSLIAGVLLLGIAWLHFSAFLASQTGPDGPRRRRMRTFALVMLTLLGIATTVLAISYNRGGLPLIRGDENFAAILTGCAAALYLIYAAASQGLLGATRQTA